VWGIIGFVKQKPGGAGGKKYQREAKNLMPPKVVGEEKRHQKMR